ncbi:hypothetical protein [uncultured Chryseobacterium sp.]|uniref:hypothetical protein n=1 Tax=uncultured Chryseobacterium sp. TaxID=259322 RepID=UPI00258B7F27|nr:hypothetical protein [uncultured Chryseobacterium sp.]
MKANTIWLLGEYLVDDGFGSKEFYNDAMELIRSEAIERDIQFDGYFRMKWEIEAENVMSFDSEYFEDVQRRDLYVFLSGLVNQDIYEFLEYIWPSIFDEDISENNLHREIYKLKEKGVTF